VKPGVGKTRNRLLLGSVALSGGVAIVLVTHQDQAHAVWHSLTGVPVAALGLVLVLVLCQLSCQALRLWAILPRHGRLTVGQTAYAFTLGEWLNIFAPVRAGDALKVVLMSRTPGAAAPSLPKATGAVLADKIVDGGSLVLLCVATGLVSVIRAGAEARLGGARTAVAAGAGVALLLLGTWWARPHWLERLVVLRREFVEGLAALKDPVRLLTSVSFSLGAWLAELLALRAFCTSLGFPRSGPQLVLALAALNLGISVPISVANLGVYEAVLAVGLTRSGIPLAPAVAIATLHHALQLLGTNLGAAGLSLWVAGRRVPDAVPGEG